MTGFIGLGTMGEPMALNLVRSGTPLLVWNRTRARSESLRSAGAEAAASIDEVFERCRVVLLMLADDAAIDAVLGRETTPFRKRVADRTIVSMGTATPKYSRELERAILDAGGRYVEAPVSGSRIPAEEASLVAMLAGERTSVELVEPLLAPMCKASYSCGSVPRALIMKLAVNAFLIATVTGLAEACHFARAHGLDLDAFRAILDAGPMSSAVSRMKLPKLLDRDFSIQAAIPDVLKNTHLITEAASTIGIASPLLDVCRELFEETLLLGAEREDMSAVVRAIETRSRSFERA